MAEEATDIIIGQLRKEMLLRTLQKGARVDGRPLDGYRPVSVQKGVIATAEGSALAKIGKSQVLAGVKITMEKPFPDRPQEGVMIMAAEKLPLAHHTFESGPPDEYAVELARVVDRGIRSAECVDVKKLFVEDGKVLGIFVDLFVLDHGGNLIDTAALAAIAALRDTKMPKIENGQIIRTEHTGPLEITKVPVSVTSIKTGDYWMVDPTRDEETTHDTRISIGVTDSHVCSIQKAKGTLTRSELMERIEESLRLGKDLRRYV